MNADTVRNRFRSAERKLQRADAERLAGLQEWEREEVLQEFFFHLVGAIDWLAQLVNEARKLGIDVEDVSTRKVIDALLPGDAIKSSLEGLYVNTRVEPIPDDAYSDEGYMWRIYNHRHQVTHRGVNAFVFDLALGAEELQAAHLRINPLDESKGNSEGNVQQEMRKMLNLVKGKCEAILATL